jgi:alpha-methylacyl-CoA racemase
MAGPLSGLTIVELAGIGPGPMCSMMLGDMGADVIRVDRTKAHVMDRLADPKFAVHNRSRRSVSVDLQKKEGVEVVLRLIEKADGITEPFRPGVAERLGLGPDVCLARNPKLVYGRMTGWGQEGPLAKAAGHDINYIALTGALHAIGVKDKPTPPLNLVGDFGGGGMLLAFGMVCGLLEAQRSGKGQVIDAAMVDGAALLLGGIYGMAGAGLWNDNDRETNMLDGGAHFYGTYACADGRYISVGALEPQFYAELCRRVGFDDPPGSQDAQAMWPDLRRRMAALFKQRTRDEWCTLLEGTDACFAPVMSLGEAPQHHHLKARRTHIEVAGVVQSAPVPRFSLTETSDPAPPPESATPLSDILRDWETV